MLRRRITTVVDRESLPQTPIGELQTPNKTSTPHHFPTKDLIRSLVAMSPSPRGGDHVENYETNQLLVDSLLRAMREKERLGGKGDEEMMNDEGLGEDTENLNPNEQQITSDEKTEYIMVRRESTSLCDTTNEALNVSVHIISSYIKIYRRLRYVE
jgi:hypothetical protein